MKQIEQKILVFLTILSLLVFSPIIVNAEETDLSNYPYKEMTNLEITENIISKLEKLLKWVSPKKLSEEVSRVSGSTPDVTHTLEIPMGQDFTFEFIPAIEGNFYFVGDATAYNNYETDAIDYGEVISNNPNIATASRKFANQYTRNNKGTWINGKLITNWGCKDLSVTISAENVGTTTVDVFYHLANSPATSNTNQLLLAQNVHEQITVIVYDPATRIETLSVGESDDFISTVTYNNLPVAPSEVVFEENGEPSYSGDVIQISTPSSLNSWKGTLPKTNQTVVGFHAKALKPGTATVKTTYGYFKEHNAGYVTNGYMSYNVTLTSLTAYVDLWQIVVEDDITYSYQLRYHDRSGNDNSTDQIANMPSPNPSTPVISTQKEYTLDISKTVPTRLGYTFKGWRSPYVNLNKIYNPGEKITIWIEDDETSTIEVDLYAVWERNFTVTYTDGVPGKTVFPDQSYEGLKTGDATPAFVGDTTRKGYIFMGWTPAVKKTVDPDMANEDEEIIYTATWSKVNVNNFDISKTPSEETPFVGKEFQYTLRITNNSPYETIVDVTDALDGKLNFASASENGTYNETTRVVTWENLKIGANSYKDLVITVSANDIGEIPNSATLVVGENTRTANATVTAKKKITYIIEWYDESGHPIKTSEVRTGSIGSIASVTDDDKLVEGYTFIENYENNNLSEEIDKDGNVVLKLYFKTDKDNAVNTGDNSYTKLYAILCLTSLAIIAGLILILKKRKVKMS